jgi:hypothetical protein
LSSESRRRSDVRRLVLVVGIGRSGTSLFTGILGQLGFHVPRPEVRPDETNPRGFSEPRWVVDFHSRLMRELRVTVFDSRPGAWAQTAEAATEEEAFKELKSWLAVQFVGRNDVVIKDPRIAWFLPLWRRCAEALDAVPGFATTLRHPAEVVKSARQWYGTWQNDASRAAAWLNVSLHTELASRGAHRAFVRYDDLLEDWPREISRAGELLDLPSLVGIDRSRHPRIESLVDPGLRRSAAGWDDVQVPPALRKQLDEVWSLASRLAEPNGDGEAVRGSLDAAREAYVQLYSEAELIAQSSATAVKPRRGRAGASSSEVKEAAANGKGPKASLRRRLAQGGLLEGGLAGLPVRMVLLVPTRYRERLPMPVVRIGLRIVRKLSR